VLNKDFREFTELLNPKNVNYLIVGGYAVGLDGNPRITYSLILQWSCDFTILHLSRKPEQPAHSLGSPYCSRPESQGGSPGPTRRKQ
jgi:hypothetical protein